MSKNIKLFRELLDHVESYEQKTNDVDIKEFSLYLRDRVIGGDPAERGSSFEPGQYQAYKSYPEIEFSTLLTGLFRFAKHYMKKAFQGTSLRTIDEFGFLASLLKEGDMLKNELINRHLLEISSGSEILKRLIKNGLVSEVPDATDRRAKRVFITEKGRQEIFQAFGDMHTVSEIVIGNLSQSELNDALSILNKLTFFHQHIHEHDRQTDLGELHKKYIRDFSTSPLN